MAPPQKRLKPSITFHEVLEACHEPGCPVCQVALNGVDNYLDALFYEFVNDAGIRHNLRRSLGFCREHAWLAIDKRFADALGTGIIYEDLLRLLIRRLPYAQKRLSAHVYPGWFPAGLQSVISRWRARKYREIPFSSSMTCPACQQYEVMSDIALSAMLEFFGDPRMQHAYQDSSGLCLPHLRQAMTFERCLEAQAQLLELTLSKWTDLKGELRELIRKHDYRFIEQGFGREGDSWKRAVAAIVGLPSRR
jgi:hypothetical protein